MSYFEYRKICGGDYTRAFFEGFYDVLVTDRSKGYNILPCPVSLSVLDSQQIPSSKYKDF